MREAALLQGFPAQYSFTGPFDDKFKQIGNAVSPIFARAIAMHLAREWFADHDSSMREADAGDDIARPLRKSFSSAIAGIKRKSRGNSSMQTLSEWLNT